MLARLRMGAVVAITMVAAACSANSEAADGPTTGAAEAETTVQVENQGFNDMTIYVYEGAQRVRLGSVTGLSTRTFRIPDRLMFGISSLRFEADPLAGSQNAISQEISVSAGESLRLVIPPS